ncbi:MAG: hypothetical protein EHM35_07015 [Planctomycetaceae bacterium]|nr:MAG: hypothetical protein EHM35_07015 [Planctomycetaceae bacterium]
MATRPIFDGPGAPVSLRKDSAWGTYDSPTHYTYKGRTYTMNRNGLAGSFGLNGYLLDIPDRSQYEGAMPAAYGWRDLPHVANADTVPMFLDALRFDLWPNHVDAPASSEMGQLAGARMTQCCVNRHDGAVNCLFVDGSVRKVGLKELWTLKWHRSFNTAGPWTKAGGVLPYDWPQWMRPFKEY